MTRFTRMLAHIHDVTTEPRADAGRAVGRGVKRAGAAIRDFNTEVLEDHEALEARKEARKQAKATAKQRLDAARQAVADAIEPDEEIVEVVVTKKAPAKKVSKPKVAAASR